LKNKVIVPNQDELRETRLKRFETNSMGIMNNDLFEEPIQSLEPIENHPSKSTAKNKIQLS
jgi:hypothetical protein